MAKYLKSKGHNIVHMVLLSPRNARVIDLDPSFLAYQITWASQGFAWYDYTYTETIINDWLVANYYVKNVERYGLVKKIGLNRFQCHNTVVSSVFGNIIDLMTVLPLQSHTNIYSEQYFSQLPQANGTLFYFVQSKQLGRQLDSPNHPGWDGNRINP